VSWKALRPEAVERESARERAYVTRGILRREAASSTSESSFSLFEHTTKSTWRGPTIKNSNCC